MYHNGNGDTIVDRITATSDSSEIKRPHLRVYFEEKDFLRDDLEKDYFQGHTLKMETNISQNLDYFLDVAYSDHNINVTTPPLL